MHRTLTPKLAQHFPRQPLPSQSRSVTNPLQLCSTPMRPLFLQENCLAWHHPQRLNKPRRRISSVLLHRPLHPRHRPIVDTHTAHSSTYQHIPAFINPFFQSTTSSNLTTSQPSPSLNGSTKHPPLARQATIVDEFKPSAYGVRLDDGSISSDANATLQHPPPLNRPQPISLRGTPTATSFNSPVKQRSSNNLFGWHSIHSISAPEILSLLVRLIGFLSPPVLAHPSVSKLLDLPAPMGQPGPSQPTNGELPPLQKAMAKKGTSPISPQDVEMASPTAAPMRNGNSKGKGQGAQGRRRRPRGTGDRICEEERADAWRTEALGRQGFSACLV